MTAKRVISADEKMTILNEGMLPGANVTEICRRHNIGTSTYHKWKRSAVQGMKEAVAGPSREVMALKQENARLKKLVAEEALVIDRLRELNETLAKGKNDGRRLSQQ
jgi:transposase-like protein